MKFFSNEAKENTDEDRDRAESDTTTVPQQRAGSPWSDAPGAAEDEIAAREGRTGTEELPEQAQAADAGHPWTRPATERDQPDVAEPGDETGTDRAGVADERAEAESDRAGVADERAEAESDRAGVADEPAEAAAVKD